MIKSIKAGKEDTHNLEYRIVHQDGNTRWVLDRGVVIDKDRNGKPLRITGTHTDITERKNAEEILEKQRKFYEDILNNMPADIAVFNPKHEYLFVNPRGIKDEELRKWIIWNLMAVVNNWYLCQYIVCRHSFDNGKHFKM